jgi:predicted transcriptional regulator
MSDTKISRPRIDDQAFVKAWMKVHASGGSQSEVARELGCTMGGVNGKFKRLEKDGVNLPALGRKGSKVDVEGLNSLIRSLSGGGA